MAMNELKARILEETDEGGGADDNGEQTAQATNDDTEKKGRGDIPKGMTHEIKVLKGIKKNRMELMETSAER